ncbi:Uncharacterised protein [Serratia fonticola]|nr:Uncharacterised protein [Serratia fonticola]
MLQESNHGRCNCWELPHLKFFVVHGIDKNGNTFSVYPKGARLYCPELITRLPPFVIGTSVLINRFLTWVWIVTNDLQFPFYIHVWRGRDTDSYVFSDRHRWWFPCRLVHVTGCEYRKRLMKNLINQ